ncbi:MAG TPA: hypothetical protein VGV93_04375 [Acidimicrobiales bacterium]|nr:hypothetical protein [Acidimicrobiales bacterium]
METIPQPSDTHTLPDGPPCSCQWDPERRRWDASRRCRACTARGEQLRRFVAEAGPSVNLHGERLDELPPLTLTDELAEVDQAVADGICSRSHAQQARYNIHHRHGVEPTPPTTNDKEPASEPAPSERATETAGCDPPVTTASRAPIPAGLSVAGCGRGCHWHIFHEASGIVVATRTTEAEAVAAARSVTRIGWAWPAADLFQSAHVGAAVRRLHEAQHRDVA